MKLRRSPHKRFLENILAVCLAWVLSLVVYQIAQYSWILTADITGWPQPEFNDWSDIVVHQSANEVLELFVGKTMRDVSTMSIIFLFDPDKVLLDEDAFRSPYTVDYSSAWEGKWMVVLSDIQEVLNSKDTLLTLSVAGNADALVVADVVAIFADGTQASLTVQLPH